MGVSPLTTRFLSLSASLASQPGLGLCVAALGYNGLDKYLD
jgi:hypothetical protein